MRYKTLVSFASTGALVQLAGCGVPDLVRGPAGDDGVHVIARVTPEKAGKNCEPGGSLLEYGRDANRNDKLDPGEISGKQFVCDGAVGVSGSDGVDGMAGVSASDGGLSTISITPEPAGENCVSGGSRIDIGVDANADGHADPDKDLSTSFVCDGAAGQDAADGRSLLVDVAEEASGSNCPDGGRRVEYGSDLDGDGALAATEVLGKSYVCDGNPLGDGSRGLVNVSTVSAGTACAAGGSRIDYGQDKNQNGVLEGAEVAGSRYVCTGAAGVDAAVPLVAITTEPEGSGCFHGGKRVDIGADTDGDHSLDPGEITQTRYVCDGGNGANGSNGSDGRTALVDASPEAAGANCESGGYKLDSGFDSDGDGTLDPSEVTNTSYVCSGRDGTNGSDGSSRSARVRVTAEPPGLACAVGGQRVESGIDDDASGSLDPAEVDDTDFVCNGADGSAGSDGANGVQSLVDLTPEAAGAHCAAGGQRVDVGLDADADGTLDPTEIASTRYVCNAADAADGLSGIDAPRSLIAVSSEPAGVRCASGGQNVSFGLDDDGDGALDAGEIDDTRYVCNGANGGNGSNGANAVNSLVSVVTEPFGTNCAAGGQRISFGLDDDGDGTLDAGEIDDTRYVCGGSSGSNGSNGGDGGNAVNSLVNVVAEPAGIQCAAAGQRITYGLDDDGDGVLAPGEVDGTRYACNGSDGSDGASGSNGSDGSNGTNALVTRVNIATEAFGSNCPGGGHRVQIGLDDDGNGTLAAGEVDSTSYVCNFVAIVNGSFESGDYFGWTFLASTTSGTWGNLASGTEVPDGGSVFDYKSNANETQSSPNLPFTYSATDGTRLAVLFQTDSDTHRIYQTVTIPPTATTLNWDMYYENFLGNFEPGNQFLAVYLRNPSTDAIEATLFETDDGSDPQSLAGMTAFSANVVAYRGQTLRLDIYAQVQFTHFPAAFDNFHFE